METVQTRGDAPLDQEVEGSAESTVSKGILTFGVCETKGGVGCVAAFDDDDNKKHDTRPEGQARVEPQWKQPTPKQISTKRRVLLKIARALSWGILMVVCCPCGLSLFFRSRHICYSNAPGEDYSNRNYTRTPLNFDLVRIGHQDLGQEDAFGGGFRLRGQVGSTTEVPLKSSTGKEPKWTTEVPQKKGRCLPSCLRLSM